MKGFHIKCRLCPGDKALLPQPSLTGRFVFNRDIHFSSMMSCESLFQRGSCFWRGVDLGAAIMWIAAERLLSFKCQNDSPPPSWPQPCREAGLTHVELLWMRDRTCLYWVDPPDWPKWAVSLSSMDAKYVQSIQTLDVFCYKECKIGNNLYTVRRNLKIIWVAYRKEKLRGELRCNPDVVSSTSCQCVWLQAVKWPFQRVGVEAAMELSGCISPPLKELLTAVN